jgi:hypothetical protein
MKNDRAHKAFELFVPGLDKEVDMASDLIKAMLGKNKVATPPAPPASGYVDADARHEGCIGQCGTSNVLGPQGLRALTGPLHLPSVSPPCCNASQCAQ